MRLSDGFGCFFHAPLIKPRPWRCQQCKKCKVATEAPDDPAVNYFPVLPSDVEACVPTALYLPPSKHSGRMFFTGRWLLNYLFLLYECMSYKAVRRRLADQVVASVLASNEPFRVVYFLTLLPTRHHLALIAKLAFPDFLATRVLSQQRWLAIYCGQGLRNLHYLEGSMSVFFPCPCKLNAAFLHAPVHSASCPVSASRSRRWLQESEDHRAIFCSKRRPPPFHLLASHLRGGWCPDGSCTSSLLSLYLFMNRGFACFHRVPVAAEYNLATAASSL